MADPRPTPAPALSRAERRREMKADMKAAKRGQSALGADERTYWNGERTPARRVRVRVGTNVKPTWWCAPLVGTERAAVEVTYYGQRFYLDDEDGSGWRKVTIGHGWPNYGHASLPDDSTVIGERA